MTTVIDSTHSGQGNYISLSEEDQAAIRRFREGKGNKLSFWFQVNNSIYYIQVSNFMSTRSNSVVTNGSTWINIPFIYGYGSSKILTIAWGYQAWVSNS